jgi:hypothetical protein
METITKDQVLIVLGSHIQQVMVRFQDLCNNDRKADRLQYISDIHYIAIDVRNYTRKLLYNTASVLPPQMALNHDEAKPDFDLFVLNLDQAYKCLQVTHLGEQEILADMFAHKITTQEADIKFKEAQTHWLRFLEITGRIASDLAIYALHLPADYTEPYALEQSKIMTGE